MKGARLRVALAVIALAAVAVTVAPHITNYISTSALVNAPIHTYRAPFNAMVVTPSMEASAPVRKNDPLLEIRATVEPRNQLAELEKQLRLAQVRKSATSQQITLLEQLAQQLKNRVANQSATAQNWISAKIKEVTATRTETKLRYDQIKADIARNEKLRQSGSVSPLTLERQRLRLSSLSQEIELQSARIEALQAKSRGLSMGVEISGEVSGGNYIRQRIDEVDILLIQLQRDELILKERIKALGAQIELEQEKVEDRSIFSPVSSLDGVLWQSSPSRGVILNSGDPVVKVADCTRRFLEVSLEERHFESIRPGDPAVITFKGSRSSFDGTVVSIRGAGAKPDGEVFAANLKEVQEGQLSIRVALPPILDIGKEEAAEFCDIGRTARVSFKRGGPSMSGLRALIASLVEKFNEAAKGTFTSAMNQE